MDSKDKIVLNSDEVATLESQEEFVQLINFLIWELVGDQFSLKTSIIDKDTFAISISGIPSVGEKLYGINFDISVLRHIYDVTTVLLSNKRFFPKNGKSTSEYQFEIENVSSSKLRSEISQQKQIYFDAERKELHSYIYKLCLHFIARHEIRHIANGHIDYLLFKLQEEEFFEYSGNGLSPLDSQTLEMDIDSCVLVGYLNGFLNLPKHLKHVPEKLRETESVFDSILFALKILFYCLPSNKASSREVASRLSHPNCTLRYFYSVTAGLTFLQESHPELVDTFGKTYQRSWSFFEIAANQGLISFDQFLDDYNWSMSDQGQEYANSVWTNWNNWYPKLQRFTYLELAPPEAET